MQRGTYGFWRGVLTGLVVALAAALALAWWFPPLRAPEVGDELQVAPPPPGAPSGGAAPGPLLAPAPGPLIDGMPAAHPQDQAPEPPAGSPGPSPGPSLVPLR